MSETLQPNSDRERFEEELDALELSDGAKRQLYMADDDLVGVILKCRNQNSFLSAMLEINPSLTPAQFQFQHVMEFYRARVSRIRGVRRGLDQSPDKKAV